MQVIIHPQPPCYLAPQILRINSCSTNSASTLHVKNQHQIPTTARRITFTIFSRYGQQTKAHIQITQVMHTTAYGKRHDLKNEDQILSQDGYEICTYMMRPYSALHHHRHRRHYIIVVIPIISTIATLNIIDLFYNATGRPVSPSQPSRRAGQQRGRGA